LILGDSNLSAGAAVTTSYDDSLVGGDGDDTLDGGGSSLGGNGDTLRGGKGNDLVYIRSSSDQAIEEIGQGYDTLYANIDIDLNSVSYANFEAVGLYGTANNKVLGSDAANLIYGNVGDNSLVGKLGNDTLYGGAGRDSLDAGEGNDYLDGGVSAVLDQGDTMNGDAGNDTYVVNNRYDEILESTLPSANDDIDIVYTYVNFDPLRNEDTDNVTRSKSFASSDTLSFAQLENFVFMGDVIRGVGNAKDNSFTGNYENNVILGLDGDDTIIGGAGNDSIYGDRERNFLSGESTLPGGGGYDSPSGTYPFNPGDYDASGLGNSSLFAATVTSGEGMDFLDGGDGNDLLSGNSKNDILLGGSGNDILYGGADIDSMVGGEGNDTFYKDSEDDIMVEQSGEGTDWVYSSVNIHQLQDNLENLVIYGSLSGLSGPSFAVGNSVDNRMYVAQKIADKNTVTLSGGIGNDSLYGNFSSIIYGYAETIEDKLDLNYPTSDIAEMENRDANDYLVGGDGNDYLYGAQGNDTMEGGLGNDTIVMTSSFDSRVRGDYDRILEFGYEGDPTNGGIDWVIYNKSGGILDFKDVYTDSGLFVGATAQSMYVQNGMFIENMQGSGVTLSGNWLNNTILGGVGSTNESLSGELGNDYLCGDSGPAGSGTSTSGGLDTLTGGERSDTFSLAGTDGNSLYLNGGSLSWLNVQGAVSQQNLLDNSFALITDYNVSEDSSLIQGSLPDLDFDDTTRVHYESLSRNYADANLNFAATYLYAVDGARADLIAIY
jgi:Ca2+-binding RTX toxin-like protein